MTSIGRLYSAMVDSVATTTADLLYRLHEVMADDLDQAARFAIESAIDWRNPKARRR